MTKARDLDRRNTVTHQTESCLPAGISRQPSLAKRLLKIGLLRCALQVSLGNKIIGLVVGLLVFFGLFVMNQFTQRLTVLLKEQLDLQATSTAKYIANRSPDYIYHNDLFSLYALVRDAKYSNKNIRYIFIVDGSGNALVDTFGGSLPRGLLEANLPQKGIERHLQVISTEEGLIRDWALPILGGGTGFVRIGMSEASLAQARLEVIRGVAAGTIVFLAVGVATAYLLARVIARPFENLVQATEEIAAGNLSYRAPSPVIEDEGGRLTLAFNQMMDKLERSAVEIQELNLMRQGLLEKVFRGQEEERARLSRELHDETSQLLASLKVVLRYLEEAPNLEAMRNRLKELRQLLDETFEGFRRFITVLRPGSLDEGDLKGSLERYAAEFERRFGIIVDLAFSGSTSDLGPEVASTLFRIAQESLTNVARHSQARHVSMVLSATGDELMLAVEDDGLGFNVEEVLSRRIEENKFGLFGIEERVRLLGGHCQIESSPGQGTALYVRIPREASAHG